MSQTGRRLSSGEGNQTTALKKLQILESLQAPLFDKISIISSKICDFPIALIRFVGENNTPVKSNVGKNGVTETPEDIAFYTKAILNDQGIELSDTKFNINPQLAIKPKSHLYLSTPIILSNLDKIGTLCIVAEINNALNETQKNYLSALTGIAVQTLSSRFDMVIAVQEKSSNLASIVESSADAIISKSLEGFILTWNQGAEKLFGYTAKEIIGKHITTLFPDESLTEEEVYLNKIKKRESVKNYETQRVTKNAELINVSITLSAIENAYGEMIGISEIARDISEQQKLKNIIDEEHEYIKVTMDSIGDAVITTDKNGNLAYLNPMAEKLTGWRTDEIIGMPLQVVFNIMYESTRLPCNNPFEACLTKGKPVISLENTILISRDGTEYAVEYSSAPILKSNNELLGVVIVSNDVTKQRYITNAMTYHASHDALTGLINRGEFEHKLEHAIISARERNLEHALLYIDLDQFKVVNESSGHQIGDILLKEISIVIGNCIRSSDAFARLGGDEFGILLEKCNPDNAMRIAQNICKSVDEYRLLVDKRRHRVGASIGLVIIDDNWLSTSHLLHAADQSCNAAKEDGRNRVHFYLDKDHALQTHLGEVQWASRIEQAIEDNNFVLYCQRILPLKGKGGLHGEVLLRLKDEQGKLISPGEFLPAAERYHMVSRIDKWVVREVFEWMRQHQDQLNHIETISINLSGQSLGDKNFNAYVLDLIRHHSMDCSKICFEITETAAITNMSVAEKFIDSMKKHDIKFSLDDFGSGVSSFGYLKKLDVDYIKIDGQFIKSLTKNAIDQATVRCITEVAKVTGKKTIAEWVEDESTEKLLKEMGINYTQGYLKHKPAPINHMLEIKCSYKQPENKSKNLTVTTT
jgi:diguanylate cyclase (GGDEF)-like protein/PAS domain S-box-containing protein